jgi:hypothetical protein
MSTTRWRSLAWIARQSGAAAGAAGQRWHTAPGSFTPGAFDSRDDLPEHWRHFNAPPVTTAQPVGTATMTFQSCLAATFSYHFTGEAAAACRNDALSRLARCRQAARHESNVSAAPTPH